MIADVLTIKTENEVAGADTDPSPVLDEVPLYNDFYTRPELYQRIHVHLIGIRAKDPKDDDAGLKVIGFLGRERLFQKADPSVVVETYGPNTGSTDYFSIGKSIFSSIQNDALPIWDSKSLVICRKGTENTEGIKFTVKDGDKDLFEVKTPITDFTVGGGDDWKEFVHTPEETKAVTRVELVYKIRVSECTDKIVDKEELAALLKDSDTVSYSEVVVEGKEEDGTENALVQCWHQKNDTASKAVLWFHGRNDCFMHPHVAKTLFLDNGYDLYVLNYSNGGMCRKRGWVSRALFNAHDREGNMDTYIDQINGAMNVMLSHKQYEKKIGYAHSTGAPVLINYLMQKGDDFFDGFIFNSPFLDWSADACGGELTEFVLEHSNMLQKLPFMSMDSMVGVTVSPEELEKPIIHLGDEVVMSAWSAKLWSQYYFDFRCRPLYNVPMTVGFAAGVSAVHEEMLKMKKEKQFVTLKPFMCITSRADDTLTASETLTRVDIIGPARCEMELRHNSHDVFLSEQKSDVHMALNLTKVWMTSNGFQ